MLARILRGAFLATGCVAIVLVVMLIAVRALGWGAELRAPMAEAFSRVLDQPVQIGEAQLSWWRWQPAVELRGVETGDGVLAAEQVLAVPDLLRTVRDGRLRLHTLRVFGATASVRQSAGAWRVEGLERVADADGAPDDAEAWEAYLPRRIEVGFRQLRAHPEGQASRRFDGAVARFARSSHGARAAIRLPWHDGDAEVSARQGALPGLIAIAHWPLGRVEQAQVYLDAHDVESSEVAALAGHDDQGVSARWSGRVWATLFDGVPVDVLLEGRLEDLDTGVSGPAPESLAGRMHAWRDRGAWHVRSGEWAVAHRNAAGELDQWRSPRLRASFSASGGDSHAGGGLTLHSDRFRIDPLPGWLRTAVQVFPDTVPEPLHAWVDASHADWEGELAFHRWGIRFGDDGGVESVHGAVRGDGLGYRPTDPERPGFRGANALLGFSGTGVEARLGGDDAELTLPGVFSRPLPLEFEADARLAGRVDRSDGRWRVGGTVPGVASGAARVHGRFHVRGEGAAAPERVFVRANADPIAATDIPHFLPDGIVAPELLDWLEQALQGGEAAGTRFLLFGDPRDFPFGDRTGIFDVQSRMVDGTLAFDPDWPELTEIDGWLRFRNGAMSIDAAQAQTADNALEDVRVSIDDLDPETPLILEVNGRSPGELGGMLRYLQQTPLGRDWLGDPIPLSGSGDAVLELGLALPLDDLRPETVEVDGRVDLNGAQVGLDGWLSVKSLHGRITFDALGLEADEVTGTLAGEPLILSARTRQRPSGSTGIDLDARWVGPVQGLLEPMPLPAGFLGDRVKGSAPWRLHARLPGFRIDPDPLEAFLTVESPLTGIAIDGPEPLGKDASERLDARVDVGFTERGLESYWVRLGDGLLQAAVSHRGKPAAQSAALRFGPGTLRLPLQGTTVRGEVERLQLAGWGRVVDALAPLWEGRDEGGATDGVEADAGLPAGIPAPLDARLRIGAVRFGERDFGEQMLGVRAPLADAIPGAALRLDGPAAAGEIAWLWTPWPGRVTAEFAHLDAPLPEAGKPLRPREATQEVLADLAEDFPALELTIHDLRLDGRPIGRFTADLARADDGMELRRLRLDGPHVEAWGEGAWRGGRTRFEGGLESADVAELLHELGQPRAVTAARTELEAGLQWPGAPWAVQLPAMEGRIALAMEDGTISDARPGAGRLVGLLSLNMLPRRILFDFRDLFGEGLAFDEIDAEFSLADGYADVEEFVVRSPAARVSMSGRMDLFEQVYDNEVRVEPNLGATLPLVGGILGGGVPGAAIGLLIEQLFGSRIDQAGGVDYRVTGPWDEPRVERGRDRTQVPAEPRR